MIDTTHLSRQLNTLATRISSFDKESAERLQLLSAAIDDQNMAEIGAWADTDIYRVIDPDALVARFAEQQTRVDEPQRMAYRLWLTPLRSVLLLLPCILFSFSLTEALQTYTTFVAQHPQSSAQSFLYLWQQSFSGQLPGWLSLGSVAGISAFLLLLFLILTVLRTFLVARQQQQQQQLQAQHELERRQLHADLNNLLAQLALYLAQQRSHASGADNLALVARRMDTLSRRMEEKLESAVATFETMTQNIVRRFDDTTTQSMSRFDGTTQHIAERFDGMAQNISGNFDGMTRNVVDHLDGMTENISENFNGMAQNITNRFEGLTQGVTKNLNTMTRGLEKKFDHMTQNVTARYEQMAQDLTQNYDATVKDMSNKYDGMSLQLMNRFSMLTDRMMEQLLSGDSYLKQLSSASSGIVQTATQLQTSATLLKETNSELTLNLQQLVGPMVDLAQQQGVLLRSTTQALDTLQQAASTLESVGMQQERWGTDLRNTLDSLDLAVEHSTEVVLKLGDIAEQQKNHNI